MSGVLFIHTTNLHEAHRVFGDPAYPKELRVFMRFVEAFKRAKEYPDYPVYVLEGGMPMFPVYLRKGRLWQCFDLYQPKLLSPKSNPKILIIISNL